MLFDLLQPSQQRCRGERRLDQQSRIEKLALSRRAATGNSRVLAAGLYDVDVRVGLQLADGRLDSRCAVAQIRTGANQTDRHSNQSLNLLSPARRMNRASNAKPGHAALIEDSLTAPPSVKTAARTSDASRRRRRESNAVHAQMTQCGSGGTSKPRPKSPTVAPIGRRPPGCSACESTVTFGPSAGEARESLDT